MPCFELFETLEAQPSLAGTEALVSWRPAGFCGLSQLAHNKAVQVFLLWIFDGKCEGSTWEILILVRTTGTWEVFGNSLVGSMKGMHANS